MKLGVMAAREVLHKNNKATPKGAMSTGYLSREESAKEQDDLMLFHGTFSSSSVGVAHCFRPGTYHPPKKNMEVTFCSANDMRLNAILFLRKGSE